MAKTNYYIKLRDGSYLNESLVLYGVLVQNNEIINVVNYVDPVIPYYVIDEAVGCNPMWNDMIRNADNAQVYKHDKLVIEKKTTEGEVLVLRDELVYDLYDENDRAIVKHYLDKYDTERYIYAINTEKVTINTETSSVAGLASGYMLAKMAYETKATVATFFDYSIHSLKFQKLLIDSDNRMQVFVDLLTKLTTGYEEVTIEDIHQYDIESINLYYDYLRSVDVRFLEIDMRDNNDIHKLIDSLPNNTLLWISNVYHYLTSLHDYSYARYLLLDELCDKKNITLLPYTRVYYES